MSQSQFVQYSTQASSSLHHSASSSSLILNQPYSQMPQTSRTNPFPSPFQTYSSSFMYPGTSMTAKTIPSPTSTYTKLPSSNKSITKKRNEENTIISEMKR